MQQDVDIIHVDSRSHLEVADVPLHRYGKNLRLYFKEFDRLFNCKEVIANNTKPEQRFTRYRPFFEWLDRPEDRPEVCDVFPTYSHQPTNLIVFTSLYEEDHKAFCHEHFSFST